jgi:hypothetical protein
VLFGSPKPSGPWPVDVLTLEYLVSGEVDEAAQKWGWNYFQVLGEDPPVPFEVVVSAVRPTGRCAKPALEGRRALFGLESGAVAFIPRGDAADAVWDAWNKGTDGVASLFLIGPYSVAGTVLAQGTQLSAVALGRAVAFRDATFTRVDGAGDGMQIAAPRATVLTRSAHAAVEAA